MRVWWSAVVGGAFYTRWSALVSLIVAGVFSVPSIGAPSGEGYLRGVVVAVVGWVVLALVIVPVAIAERRVRSAAGRAALVLGGLVVVAASRAGVNDAISGALFGLPTGGSMIARGVTNLVTALALFSIVAIITTRHSARQRAARRLDEASARLTAARARSGLDAAAARDDLAAVVAGLRSSREDLLEGDPDFDAVRAYADEVRAASHRLDARSRRRRTAPDTPVPRRPERVPGRERLVPPPWLTVGPLYAVACAPFAAAAGGPGVAAAGLGASVVVDALAGVLLRAGRRVRGARRTSAVSPVVFGAVWIGAGLAMLGVTFALLPDIGSLGFVPVLAVPVVALLVSLCRDALHRARDEESRASAGVARIASDGAADEWAAAAPFRRATELLHGGVQGKCVVFAALVDERAPATSEVAAFRRATDAVFDDILAPPSADLIAARAVDALDALLRAWHAAVSITRVVDPSARAGLARTDVADAVVTIVTEGLVNAVKHSGARSATVAVAGVGEDALRVRVESPGTLAPASPAGLGSAAARIFQEGDRVVLEADVTLSPVPPTRPEAVAG
ncbi:sensor histidine kinase [Microbacterium radiodurans]|uniref:Signal transduction histidine kinase n=1 Tax=Microbacterium radiodurans TaxID=661398 RepID=A0A5J5IN13_9MICO|nr:hypothetical protein [Microbacterium radiodurans]KAA9084099.1 hypothetical protein F6B42_14020 [Microbacterium radiodurans]